MKMNKRQQVIEDIRREMVNEVIGDDIGLFIRFEKISQKLWMLSHKLTKWQSFKVRIKRFLSA